LLVLSPLLLAVAAAIRIESRGPVIYSSARVGRNYRVFRLFKFRTMYPDADRRLAELGSMNQYADPNLSAADHCPECARLGSPCSVQLMADGGAVVPGS
jgi:lipopolysaccharide/colanic/teichoic acid biosynthesis glycosyltransferase